MIRFESKYGFLEEKIEDYQEVVNELHDAILNKTKVGSDFLGWVEWPNNYDKKELEAIKAAAKDIQGKCDVLLVCGIGGSYLGSRAAIEMINGLYANKKPEIIFCGNTFSSTYTKQVLDYIQDKDVCLNVISKSGTTTETAIAFRLIKQFLEGKYGEEAARRIYATTDKAKGTLYELAKAKGYQMFCIPDDIGGRFSVTTAVGLLPIAVAGINVDDILAGSKQAYDDFASPGLKTNSAYAYGVARRILEKQGKSAEMFVTYDLQTTMLAEWWKQLFGESEGKDGKGLLPTSGTFSTDLHSLGQFVQDGTKMLFETLVLFDTPNQDILFPQDDENLDSMNYLAGKSIDWVNKCAMEGTLDAHVQTGQVPNLQLFVQDMSAKSFGYLVYFFFRSVALSAYMLDINPFDQPGVEVYKKNMFSRLGKV